jgi:hypothetical protein
MNFILVPALFIRKFARKYRHAVADLQRLTNILSARQFALCRPNDDDGS